MPRVKSAVKNSTSAVDIFRLSDDTVFRTAVTSILSQGGAVMLGQTRDNAKLIVTVYLDGDSDKEYCEDIHELAEFLGQYQV